MTVSAYRRHAAPHTYHHQAHTNHARTAATAHKATSNVRPTDQAKINAYQGQSGFDSVSSADKAGGPQAASPQKLGGGNPSIDFNGTKYTKIEGSAANSKISLEKGFDANTQDGIALTKQQASQLGVKVGDTVHVRDNLTSKTYPATFHDSAGRRSDGFSHFEVSPTLADKLGINYRNSSGRVIDAVTNTESLRGRFSIEK